MTSSPTDTVSPRSRTLDCTLVLCGRHVWRMSVVRARVTLALAYLCMQCMTRVHVEMNCKEKIVHFIFIAHNHIENYGNACARVPGKGQDSMSH